MSFADEFASDEKIEKLSKFTGAKGGTFYLNTLQLGEYIDVKFREIKKVLHEKTIKYNEKGSWSGIVQIISVSGKEYNGMEVNLWLSDNLRNSMGSELKKRKTPLTEQEVINNYWRIFPTQNKKAPEIRWVFDPISKRKVPPIIYSAVLVTDRYGEKADTQDHSGGVSAEDMFK